MAHTAEFTELLEYQADRVLHPSVRIFLQPVIGRHVSDGYRGEQLASRCHLFHGLLGALAQNRELHLTDRAFHAEQQSIVGVLGIVDAIVIDDQRLHESADLQQRVPFATVSGQPRRLDGEHGTHRPFAHPGQ